jgi:hypothetical protein
MVRVTENRLEPPANGRGLFSYLFDKVKLIPSSFDNQAHSKLIEKLIHFQFS